MSILRAFLCLMLVSLANLAAAQSPAIGPVRIPPPLAFARIPPPPYPFDSSVASRALDLMRLNEGWGSLGMNLYHWRPGHHQAPVAGAWAPSFVPVMPFDLSVHQVGLRAPTQTAPGVEAGARAAFEQRAAALRALAASVAPVTGNAWSSEEGNYRGWTSSPAEEAWWDGGAGAFQGQCVPGGAYGWGYGGHGTWLCP
ncbi:MAG: hypothetical protein K2Y51_22605 [Gammaproteobacteria bacterium]|jgi:hypothetical protein|nr:hypothetical protein [Gammaproteobacteria bacterium]